MSRRRARWAERQLNVGLKAGQYVAWSASSGQSKGRVVSVHTGKVPGVIGEHTATVDKPAARVQLYAKSGAGWEPTTVHIAHSVTSLTSIDPLPEATQSALTEAVIGSFDDIRANVEDAIKDRIEQAIGVCPENLYVYDIGFTWAVYRADYGADLQMVEYAIDAAGAVVLSDPIEVSKVTSYVPDVDANPAPVTVAPTVDDSPIVGPGVDGAVYNDGVFSETVRHYGRLLGAMGADPAGNRVFEVQIIAYGDSKNGRRYPEGVMRAAAPLYNGAKAYDHHRTEAELNTGTTVGIVGHYRNVEATATGLKGELHLLPSATHVAELLDQTLVNQAEGLPLLVGISHDVMTKSVPAVINGRQGREVTSIDAVNSSDVVADPAAGGGAMRMVANTGGTPQPKEINVTYKQLLALFRATESAKRPALLAEHGQLIEGFGFTTEEFSREIESAQTPVVPTKPVERDTEVVVTLAKASASARMLIDHSISSAKLDRHAEAITAELGDTFTEADLETTIGRYKRATEAIALAPTVPAEEGGSGGVKVRFDTMDKKKAALDAFFDGNWTEGYKSFKTAYLDITGYRGNDLFNADFNRRILQESAGTDRGFYDSMRDTESVTSSTWNLILGDSITRHMVGEYNREDWQVAWQLVNTYPLNDFRTQRVDRLGDYAVLPTVAQGAPYQPLTTPGNEEATYAPTKRGGTEDLTLETIANDDIRAIVRIPQRLGIAAAETAFKFIMDFYIAPITCTYDSVATFNASHNNTATNALNDTNLSTGWATMLKQSALNGTANFLPVQPKFLLAPPDLRQMALVLCQSAVAVPSGIAGASNVPNVNQGLIPIIVPYWTGTSTTAWFLSADPARTPFVEIGLYQGKKDPDLFVQSDQTIGSMFDSDKITYKIRHIYGGTVVDHRGAYRGNT